MLLIGNPDPDDPMYSNDVVGDIPMKQVWHRLAGERSGTAVNNGFFWGDATDWYYSDLSGDWDVNGDGFYGVRPWLRPQDVVKSALPAGIPATPFIAAIAMFASSTYLTALPHLFASPYGVLRPESTRSRR